MGWGTENIQNKWSCGVSFRGLGQRPGAQGSLFQCGPPNRQHQHYLGICQKLRGSAGLVESTRNPSTQEVEGV